MNGRVIFFPTKFFQSEEKLRELLEIQEKLKFSRISFINAINRESKFQQTLAHNRFKSMVKERLLIISSVSDQ